MTRLAGIGESEHGGLPLSPSAAASRTPTLFVRALPAAGAIPGAASRLPGASRTSRGDHPVFAKSSLPLARGTRTSLSPRTARPRPCRILRACSTRIREGAAGGDRVTASLATDRRSEDRTDPLHCRPQTRRWFNQFAWDDRGGARRRGDCVGPVLNKMAEAAGSAIGCPSNCGG